MNTILPGSPPRIAWAVLLVYVGLIFFVSSRSDIPSPQRILHWDKVAHLIEYGILGFLSQRAARLTWPRSDQRAVMRRGLLALLAGLCIGAADEIFQGWVPHRESSLADFAADAGGLAIGLVLNRPTRSDRPPAGVEIVDGKGT